MGIEFVKYLKESVLSVFVLGDMEMFRIVEGIEVLKV